MRLTKSNNRRKLEIRRLAPLLLATTALANEISVEPREVPAGEAVEIVVRLEGSFARIDRLGLPVTNLHVEQGPNTETQFRWINGVASRSKVFRYIARPLREGMARVGPLDLVDRDGRRLHLDAVSISVLPEGAPSARRQRRGRGLLVTVEADKTEAYLGEQIVVTWTLYSREPIRGFRLTSVPVLGEFWSEEIPQEDQDSEQTMIRGEILYRATVRRVALYPLSAGVHRLAAVEVLAEVMVPDDFFGGWGFLERRVEDYRLRSGTLQLRVKPTPAGVTAVGQFSMQCGVPLVPRRGPVPIDVTLSGTGNLRGVSAPRFEQPVSATVEVQSRQSDVARDTQPIRMTRTWRFLLFPRGPGHLNVPAMKFEYFDPASGTSEVLRCEGQRLEVSAENLAAPTSFPSPQRGEGSGVRGELKPKLRVNVPFLVGIAALAISGAVWAGAIRLRADTPFVQEIWRHRADSRELRRIFQDVVHSRGFRSVELFQDPSSLGESYRALHSLIDVMEKEPWEMTAAEPELKRRARDFDRELRRR